MFFFNLNNMCVIALWFVLKSFSFFFLQKSASSRVSTQIAMNINWCYQLAYQAISWHFTDYFAPRQTLTHTLRRAEININYIVFCSSYTLSSSRTQAVQWLSVVVVVYCVASSQNFWFCRLISSHRVYIRWAAYSVAKFINYWHSNRLSSSSSHKRMQQQINQHTRVKKFSIIMMMIIQHPTKLWRCARRWENMICLCLI